MSKKEYARVSDLPDDILFVAKKDSKVSEIYTVWAVGYPSLDGDRQDELEEAYSRASGNVGINITGGKEDLPLEEGLILTKDEVENKLGIAAVGIDREGVKFISEIIHDNDKAPSERVQSQALKFFPGIIRGDASPEIQMEAISSVPADRPFIVSHIVASINQEAQDPAAMHKAIKKAPDSARHMRSDLQKQFGYEAVSKNPNVIINLKNPSPETIKIAVVANPYLIMMEGKCEGLKHIPTDVLSRARKEIESHEQIPKMFRGQTVRGRQLEEGKKQIEAHLKISEHVRGDIATAAEPARTSNIGNLIADARKNSESNPGSGSPGDGPGDNHGR